MGWSPLEAEEEAEGGLAGAGAAGDGEVVGEEVGLEIDKLAEAHANAEVVRAAGEVLLDAEVVVVGGAVLEGKALAAVGRGLEADGAAAGAEVGLDAVEAGRVGDVAEGDLADAGLRAVQQARDERGGEGEVLGVAGVAEVELEAGERLGDVAQGDEFADRAAGGDEEVVAGAGGVALLDAGDVGADDSVGADGEVEAVELLLEGRERVASCPMACDAVRLRRQSRRAGTSRLVPAGTDRRNGFGMKNGLPCGEKMRCCKSTLPGRLLEGCAAMLSGEWARLVSSVRSKSSGQAGVRGCRFRHRRAAVRQRAARA